MNLVPNQTMGLVFTGEPWNDIVLVFPHSPREVARDSDMQRPVRLVCENVDVELPIHECCNAQDWAPAYAGVTACAGVTK